MITANVSDFADRAQDIIHIPVGSVVLEGNLIIPRGTRGLVVFAHGSGSSRHSPRNRYVASVLQQAGLATLLIDLLSQEEEDWDVYTRELRFDIGLLADRLAGVTQWLKSNANTKALNVGYFGASTGAAAALIAAARYPDQIHAVVSRGGRPDLAGSALRLVKAPTLLLVGGNDYPVIPLNEAAMAQLPGMKKMVIIPGATHLFEEPGTLEAVAQHAAEWFVHYLVGKVTSKPTS